MRAPSRRVAVAMRRVLQVDELPAGIDAEFLRLAEGGDLPGAIPTPRSLLSGRQRPGPRGGKGVVELRLQPTSERVSYVQGVGQSSETLLQVDGGVAPRAQAGEWRRLVERTVHALKCAGRASKPNYFAGGQRS